MTTRFVSANRNQPLLLPPDLRDWIPEDDLIHFVIQATEGLNLSAFKVNAKASGSAQYPPHMMLSLLIYCYANGVFSSRRIERGTYRDIAVRFLTATPTPIMTPSQSYAGKTSRRWGPVFFTYSNWHGN
jgi:transposase